MKEKLTATFKAAAGLIMNTLVTCGLVARSYAHFVNMRRPEGCPCRGCQQWARVERGEVTLEEVGQAQVRCSFQYEAWRASTIIDQRWNPVMGMFLCVMLLLAIMAPFTFGVMAIVTTAGKNDILSKYFKGSAYTAAWFVGLVDGGSAPTYAAGDTMASHAGWTESAAYSNSTRVSWTGGTVSAGSVDNSASPAAFNINGTATIAGSFMVSDGTKSGTAGTLYSEANFTQGNRSVLSGDTLNCTCTETMA